MTELSSDRRARRLALNLRADLVAAEVARAASANDLDVLLLRGPVVGVRLYESGERTYNDCDFLALPAHRGAVEAMLVELGFTPITRPGLSQHWRRDDGTEIDLHVSLWGVRRSPATLWNALTRDVELLPLGGFDVPAPGKGATAFILALHAAQHGGVVRHVFGDVERAVVRFREDAWQEAAALAAETGSLLAFRQGLTMVEGGDSLLRRLGLQPELSTQAVLRQRGIELPSFLYEGLSLRERLRLLAGRVAPERRELARSVDARAAESTKTLLLAHGHRLLTLPGRTVRLAREWRRARETSRASRTSR